MRTPLAGRILDSVLDWDDTEREQRFPRLLTFARLKWDSYEGFRAGQRFLESLVRWLPQFDRAGARLAWLDFVLEQLVFVSNAELHHAITTVYPDYVRPQLIGRVATALRLPAHRTAQIVQSVEFKTAHRRVLVLGLTDGARLDQLRRASQLANSQFWLAPEVPHTAAERLLGDLDDALTALAVDSERTFDHVVFVDDFSGSGRTLITSDGTEGKLPRALADFTRHATGGNRLVSDDFTASVVLYCASEGARAHVRSALNTLGHTEWPVHVIQPVPSDLTVTDTDLLADCDAFYDDVLTDPDKGAAARGFKACALPVVLAHNAPNNSVSPLWADSVGRESLERHALFPRYERHHSERR